MNERAIELSRSHAILWVFLGPGNGRRYSEVIRSHRDFSDGTAGSLSQGFCGITGFLSFLEVFAGGQLKLKETNGKENSAGRAR